MTDVFWWEAQYLFQRGKWKKEAFEDTESYSYRLGESEVKHDTCYRVTLCGKLEDDWVWIFYHTNKWVMIWLERLTHLRSLSGDNDFWGILMTFEIKWSSFLGHIIKRFCFHWPMENEAMCYSSTPQLDTYQLEQHTYLYRTTALHTKDTSNSARRSRVHNI